jgi:hypothetical protein
MVICLSALSFPPFVYLIDMMFHSGAYLVCIFFISVWLWSGIAGGKDAWWMPDRVTNELKYGSKGRNASFWDTELANHKGLSIIFLVISAPIYITIWVSLAILFLGPVVLGAVALNHLFSIQMIGAMILLVSCPFFWGLITLLEKQKAFEDTAIEAINDIRKSAKLKKNNAFRNLEFDVTEMCKKKSGLESLLYCITIISVELLVINYL